MRSRRQRWAIAGLIIASASCTDAAQSQVTVPVHALGVSGGLVTLGNWQIGFCVAKVALGPMYFCAAASGSATLCQSAQAEVRSIAVVDLLDLRPQSIGWLRGETGRVRSASFDYGILWTATQSNAASHPSNTLGHSAYFEGEARNGVLAVPFTATIDIAPQYRGQRTVPTVATEGTLTSNQEPLTIRLDFGKWFSQVDFDKQAAGQTLTILPGSSEHNAVVLGMTSISPPQFGWGQTPLQ